MPRERDDLTAHFDGPTELLTHALSGDMDAFGEFYDNNVLAVLGFFQARVACPDTAADLTSETFASALESLATYRPEDGSARMWLFGIARHQLSRYWRWRRVDTRSRAKLGMTETVVLDDESYQRIDDLVDFAPTRRRLERGLSRLSQRLLDAVRLRIEDELSYAEIAARLGCTEAAARARVSRALRKLGSEEGVNI